MTLKSSNTRREYLEFVFIGFKTNLLDFKVNQYIEYRNGATDCSPYQSKILGRVKLTHR